MPLMDGEKALFLKYFKNDFLFWWCLKLPLFFRPDIDISTY